MPFAHSVGGGTAPIFALQAVIIRLYLDANLASTSGADLFHFYTDPDPWIRFVEKRILIRPKI